MSEPRAVAHRLEPLLPGLRHCHLQDERIDFRSDAYVLDGPRGAILIDPLPLAPGTLESIGPIAAIVLTAPSHQRSAWRLRRATGAPVHAPRDATGLLEPPDLSYADGERLPGDLRAVHAPGPTESHHVLYLALGPGVLLLGDLLLREPDGRVRHLTADHLDDPSQARRSVRRLLEFRFDVVGFAHGEPIHPGGRSALETVAERDAAELE
ncbi:MAG TPA: MBL fold metallo-hydrolase [Candidatus Polarisedimenticolia bacterium]|nr:MBL fold metallo-hydrolase [Candidatus Polarisedimenticolia bacterium]